MRCTRSWILSPAPRCWRIDIDSAMMVRCTASSRMPLRAQFGAASNQLFAGIAEPRVQAVAERLSAELRSQTRDRWDRILAAHSKALGVEFSLRDGELQPMAGVRQDLPEELVKNIR